MKICPVETELLHANLHTDRRDEANFAFRNFAKSA